MGWCSTGDSTAGVDTLRPPKALGVERNDVGSDDDIEMSWLYSSWSTSMPSSAVAPLRVGSIIAMLWCCGVIDYNEKLEFKSRETTVWMLVAIAKYTFVQWKQRVAVYPCTFDEVWCGSKS